MLDSETYDNSSTNCIGSGQVSDTRCCPYPSGDPTLERGVKCKGTTSNDEVSQECDEEYLVVVISIAISHAHNSKINEDQIGKRVDHLCNV